MKRIFVLFTAICLLFLGRTFAKGVFILYEKELPQIEYAAQKIKDALFEKQYDLTDSRTNYDFLISLAVHPGRLAAEAYSIIPEEKIITIYGGDPRGLIYGAMTIAEHLRNDVALQDIKREDGKPNLEFRGIKYNLPWHTYRPSSALDQHFETARDLNYWEAFLDMMVENRFNAISLWNMDPYTFMIKSKNFPEACPWSEQELAQWQHLYHEIFRMAKERALDTYIVHWNIFVSKEFSEAHNVARENFYPHYYVPGDTSEIVRRYLRESVKQVLEEYPNLDGIGVSHGEGMAGMTPLQRQQWMDDVLIAGMLEVDRPVKLIHRVPFSSGSGSEPGVSKNVEQVTRAAMENLGDHFDGPIWVEIKFNWSHGHSTPKLEKVHGGKLGDTYFVPKPKNYKITWQIRNEDFFALRWGVPDFIRKHIANNGQADFVGGYFIGSETYIPALDYFTAVDDPVDWTWAFERQWLFYKLWGRLLYNPQTPDEVFQAEFTRRYGAQGTHLLQAYALASNTQLRLASVYDSRWDFTLYSEGFLALQGDSTRYISVDCLIDQPVMAAEYVSVREYVAKTLNAEKFEDKRITPYKLAAMLEKDNREALRLVEDIDISGNASLMYEVADIKVWAYLGLHLAEKLKGAVALHTFRINGNLKDKAVEHLKNALEYWDKVIEITRPIYKDMRLTHYNHNFFTANDNNWFHWALIRDEVAGDIEIALRAKKISE
jgi:Glycosyl hydrolase family 20, domain 2